VIESLQPGDRLALVSFASEARLVFGLSEMSKRVGLADSGAGGSPDPPLPGDSYLLPIENAHMLL
jgi:hypothetical protein